jgi:aspartate/methionine/tyrosine aminotransferase
MPRSSIILNTPSNPSGKLFTREESEALAALAHDLLIFTDEIYEYFLYDGKRHLSIATLPLNQLGRCRNINPSRRCVDVQVPVRSSRMDN